MIPQWLNEVAMILHLPIAGGVCFLIYREILKDYQHKLIWSDYKKRHTIENGDK